MKITLKSGMELEVRSLSGSPVREPKQKLTPEETKRVRIEKVELDRDRSGQLFARTPGSATGRSYRVYQHKGTIRCECPSFMFQRGTLATKTCKHIQATFEREEVPAEWTPGTKKTGRKARAR